MEAPGRKFRRCAIKCSLARAQATELSPESARAWPQGAPSGASTAPEAKQGAEGRYDGPRRWGVLETKNSNTINMKDIYYSRLSLSLPRQRYHGFPSSSAVGYNAYHLIALGLMREPEVRQCLAASQRRPRQEIICEIGERLSGEIKGFWWEHAGISDRCRSLQYSESAQGLNVLELCLWQRVGFGGHYQGLEGIEAHEALVQFMRRTQEMVAMQETGQEAIRMCLTNK